MKPTARPVTPAPQHILGTTDYYRWRAADFLNRYGSHNHVPSYYLDYGDKYVVRFQTATRSELSDQGRQWLDSALVQLQERLEYKLKESPDLEFDSEQLSAFAFASHAYVYQKAGFFELPLRDLRAILLTLDFKDSFLNRHGRKQLASIVTRYLSWKWGNGNGV